jgi:hypothetical protein
MPRSCSLLPSFFFPRSSISPSIRVELVFNVPSARPSQIVSCKRVGLISRTDSWPHSFPTQSSPCILFQTELFAFQLIEPNVPVIRTWPIAIQCLIQLIAHVTINNSMLFCAAPPTFFYPCRPYSGRSYTEEYIYYKCCQRYAYVKLKYNVIN